MPRVLRERPVLLYHQVGDYEEGPASYHLSPAGFCAHLAFLAKSFRVVSLGELLAEMRGEGESRQDSLSLTFDGGFRDHHERVFPLLLERGWRGAFFVPADYVGGSHSLFGAPLPCLGWGDLREMAGAGMAVGSLGRRGKSLKEIASAEEAREDARSARQTIEDRLGMPVLYHAYREGVPGRALREFFAEQGFEAVLTLSPTFARPDLHALGRIQVDEDDLAILRAKTSPLYFRFKDSRAWPAIRRLRLDRATHRLLELYARVGKRKGTEPGGPVPP